jgi:hypothetical protein
LKEQLVAIAQIVQDALVVNNLQQYQADIDAYGRLYHEYLETNSKSRLDFLLNNRAVTLSRLTTTGFSGYRTYMIGAGLRLAALQDEMNQEKTGPGSFVAQRETAKEFHNQIKKTIEEQTEPATVFQRFNGASWNRLSGPIRYVQLNDKILSEKVDGILLINDQNLKEPSEGEARLLLLNYGTGNLTFDHWVSIAETRSRLLAENTDIGEKIIERWDAAKLLKA